MTVDINNHNTYLKLNRPFRYDFFTIWGNGLSAIDEIINILRNERSISIVRIESRVIENMEKFIYDLYACDTVPINHLRTKLRYLFDTYPKIIVIFVKNFAPNELPVGRGEFRKIQCQNINQIKIKIRNMYNPRHPDKDFQIKPLNKGMSHEHVIHASDQEEQVDYVLKLLGYSEGIKFIGDDDKDLPFRKPYHIPRPEKYLFKTIRIEDLRATILYQSNSRKTQKRLTNIIDTPHYLALCNGGDIYKEYLNKYLFTFLKDDHQWEKLHNMSKLQESQISAFNPILVEKDKGYYRILDGVHRAAVAQYRGLNQIKSVELLR